MPASVKSDLEPLFFCTAQLSVLNETTQPPGPVSPKSVNTNLPMLLLCFQIFHIASPLFAPHFNHCFFIFFSDFSIFKSLSVFTLNQ